MKFLKFNTLYALSDYADSRNNNFNLVRFIASLLVLFTHSFALYYGSSSFEPFSSSYGFTLGTIAVDVFFITSGYLIFKSLNSAQSLYNFIFFRLLRIYPGLIFSLFLTLIVLACFSEVNTYDYFTSIDSWVFLIKNSVLLLGIEYNLPGVFLSLPYAGVVNGSLWTLPYEIAMYGSLIIVYICKIVKIEFLRCFLGSVTVFIALIFFSDLPRLYGLNTLFKLALLFYIGSCFYAFKDSIFLNSKFALLLLVVLIASIGVFQGITLIYYLCLPYCLFWLIYMPSGNITSFNKFGDYSYGIYIYAFPIQQLILELSFDLDFYTYTILSAVITILVAFLSWRFIEEKSLKLKRIVAK
jgi:peptidoglycan/LPS O-acetylase OafA/YrhL